MYLPVEVVKGQVKDASGKPLPGVTVMLKGTSVGTATNIDGKYEIKVPAKEGVVICVLLRGDETARDEVFWSKST